jgi:hypothetical protein
MIEIDTSDVDRVAALLRGGAADVAIDHVADVAVVDMAHAVQTEVRRAARRHRKTGRMESAVAVTVAGEGVDVVARVTAGDVAPIIVRGQRPHEIRPLNGRVLAFAGGVTGFAAYVQHPGVAPDPFVARGLAAASGELGAIADDAARHTAAELAARLEG